MAAPSNNSKMAVSNWIEIQIDWNIYTPRPCSLHTRHNVQCCEKWTEKVQSNSSSFILTGSECDESYITCQIDSIKLDCITSIHTLCAHDVSGSTMSCMQETSTVAVDCRVMENINIPSESILHLLLFPRKLCFFFLYSRPFLSLAECSGQNGGSSRDRSQSEEDFPAHPPKKKRNQTRNALVVGCILIYIAVGCRCRVQWGGAKKMTRKKKKKKLFYFVFILLLLFTPWFSIFLNLSLAAWAAVIDAEQRKSPGKMRSCWRRNISASFFLLYNRKRRKSFDGNRQAFNLTLMMR